MVSDSRIKVLHITTHLGGGVGKALSSIVTHEQQFNPSHEHKILLLDDPEKDQFVSICRSGGIEVLLKSEYFDIDRELTNADIVVLHWWHHPVMASFLHSFPKSPIRLIIWAHVNGCNYPCLPFGFVNKPHNFFFTSPFSLENIYWSEQQRIRVKKKSSIVFGLGELKFYSSFKKTSNKKFVIGYIGTLSSSKLHPEFIEYCYAVLKKVPDAYFIMVGDISSSNNIINKAKIYNIQDRLHFTGYSNHIVNELSQFDVFAYPLNPKHFGTTENVLLEAMAFGLPVVVLNHNTEKYIIKNHKHVGFKVDSIDHYAESIKYLYDHPDERKRIGANGREFVRNNYTFENNVKLMRNKINSVYEFKKKCFEFKSVFGEEPYEWFLSCLGEDYDSFSGSINEKLILTNDKRKILEERIKACSPILKEKTKSSIQHFAETYPNDKYLQYWKKLLI